VACIRIGTVVSVIATHWAAFVAGLPGLAAAIIAFSARNKVGNLRIEINHRLTEMLGSKDDQIRDLQQQRDLNTPPKDSSDG
jgi:hypothetical protein